MFSSCAAGSRSLDFCLGKEVFMWVSDCVLRVDTFCDYPQEWYIFCRSRSSRSDYFETVGGFDTPEKAEAVLREMTENGGMVYEYRKKYGG